jgi:hypothetical protein
MDSKITESNLAFPNRNYEQQVTPGQNKTRVDDLIVVNLQCETCESYELNSFSIVEDKPIDLEAEEKTIFFCGKRFVFKGRTLNSIRIVFRMMIPFIVLLFLLLLLFVIFRIDILILDEDD